MERVRRVVATAGESRDGRGSGSGREATRLRGGGGGELPYEKVGDARLSLRGQHLEFLVLLTFSC